MHTHSRSRQYDVLSRTSNNRSARKHLPSPATAPATASSSTPAHTTTTTATTAVGHLLACLVLGLGRIIDEQGIERQGVGQDVVADRRAANVHGVQLDWFLALGRHFDVAQRGVHLGGNGSYRAVDDGAYELGRVPC